MHSSAGLLMLSFVLAGAAEIPAFPGAEGYGSTTPGGRGGQVLFVTNLKDSGPGSLRAAVETKGPRMILFRTGGIIDLERPLVINEPFVTIAGQSAPGDGICLRGENFAIRTHDVVIRYIRARLGDLHRREDDSISIQSGARRVVLDHVSASWSVDETLSPSGDIADVTVQWSIISESLNQSVHSKGPHGYGMLLRATGGVSIHHNLYADHNGRNPRFGDNYFKPPAPTFDFRNNLIFNYGEHCSGMVDGDMRVNYVNNFIKPGPSSSAKGIIHLTKEATAVTRFYLAGNVVEGEPGLTGDPSRFFTPAGVATIVDQPFDTPPVTTSSAREASRAVLEQAGATFPKRDLVDLRIVDQVRNGKGRLINSQKDVGGWPEYEAGQAPADSDNDGIPDEWEIANGLNPKDPSDARRLRPDGYTNLEAWLNSLLHR